MEFIDPIIFMGQNNSALSTMGSVLYGMEASITSSTWVVSLCHTWCCKKRKQDGKHFICIHTCMCKVRNKDVLPHCPKQSIWLSVRLCGPSAWLSHEVHEYGVVNQTLGDDAWISTQAILPNSVKTHIFLAWIISSCWRTLNWAVCIERWWTN